MLERCTLHWIIITETTLSCSSPAPLLHRSVCVWVCVSEREREKTWYSYTCGDICFRQKLHKYFVVGTLCLCGDVYCTHMCICVCPPAVRVVYCSWSVPFGLTSVQTFVRIFLWAADRPSASVASVLTKRIGTINKDARKEQSHIFILYLYGSVIFCLSIEAAHKELFVVLFFFSNPAFRATMTSWRLLVWVNS